MIHYEAISLDLPDDPAARRTLIDRGILCYGPLAAVASHTDFMMVDGAIVERIVTVYRCEACDCRFSFEGDRLLNSYHVPSIGAMVGGLARAFDAKPHLPAGPSEW